MNNKLNKNWIRNTKTHIWSHLMSCMGWVHILYVIHQFIKPTDIFFFIVGLTFIIYCSSISLIVFYLIEKFCFRNFQIKYKFIYTNKIYNIIWNIGFWIMMSIFLIWLIYLCFSIIGIIY